MYDQDNILNVKKIRDLMTKKGISVMSLSRHMEVVPKSIYNMLAGNNFMVLHLYKMAEALGVHPFELLMDYQSKSVDKAPENRNELSAMATEISYLQRLVAEKEEQIRLLKIMLSGKTEELGK